MTLIVAESGLGTDFNFSVRKLRKAFSLGFELYRDTMIDELALIDTVSKEDIVQLYATVDASGYKIQGLTDQTVYEENPGLIIGECSYKRLDLFAIQWGDLWSALTKARVIESMPSMAGKPRRIVLLEALKLLNSNPTTRYDNGAFFGTHAIDPFGDPADTTSNIITAPLTSTGWNTVLQTIMTRRAPGSAKTGSTNAGRVFMPNGDLAGKDIIILDGDTGVDSALAKIFDPRSLYATFPNTTSGATETRKVYTQATTQFVPEMSIYNSHPIGGAITNYVYVLVKRQDGNKPLYVRMPDPPQMPPVENIPEKHMKRVKAFQTFGVAVADPFALYVWKFS